MGEDETRPGVVPGVTLSLSLSGSKIPWFAL